MIGCIILCIGICIIPFLKYMLKENSVPNTILIYLLFLFNTVSMYFISYKDTLITADQQYYKLGKILFISNCSIYFLQILILYMTKNFIYYLLIQLFVTLVQRILCNRKISKEYSDKIDFYCKEKISKNELKVIKDNVKAMFCHRVGYHVVQGTDNIIISSFINVATVGVYGNYLSLTSMINTLLYTIFTSVTSSFGNLAVLEDDGTLESVFNKLNFLAFIVFGFATLCFAALFVPFIKLWIGENYVLPSTTILLICFNFYIYGIRAPIDTAKEAAGVYREDKYAPLIWSALNIILSIAFVKLFGLIGVVLGTTVSSLLVPCWNRPYIVYKYVFHSSSIKYFKDAIKKLLILIIMYIAIYFIISHFIFDNLVIVIIYRLLVCFVVFSIFILLFFRKSDEFKFYVEFIKTKILHK
ncbi:polysaccharide biosynthesis C-terminal domain-containing protein [Thomasclavelia cocleata]|nr:polysaccharide biosynthesis C-terminal domain-containing protein [Thomasclavelia cocleata]